MFSLKYIQPSAWYINTCLWNKKVCHKIETNLYQKLVFCGSYYSPIYSINCVIFPVSICPATEMVCH